MLSKLTYDRWKMRGISVNNIISIAACTNNHTYYTAVNNMLTEAHGSHGKQLLDDKLHPLIKCLVAEDALNLLRKRDMYGLIFLAGMQNRYYVNATEYNLGHNGYWRWLYCDDIKDIYKTVEQWSKPLEEEMSYSVPNRVDYAINAAISEGIGA